VTSPTTPETVTAGKEKELEALKTKQQRAASQADHICHFV
jgi:hypothetical protein